MNIAAMNIRITIQENSVVTDRIGNHRNEWTDLYTCWATPVQAGGSEGIAAGAVTDKESQNFTIRYTKLLDGKDATKIRVLLGNTIYNVISIDQMSFKKKSLKLKCEKVKR